MAEQHDAIDLRTLEQVQHLLATTTFASIEDLAGRSGHAAIADYRSGGSAADQTRSRAASREADPADLVDSSGAAPLPRRR
jgi:hypothetical protein